MRRLPALLLTVAAWLAAADANACPFCDSSTGEQVRASIFNAEFFYNLSVLLLPFPILIAVIACIYLGLPWDRPGKPPKAGAFDDQQD